jgi:selenocysteine lyase/cysteine desulfurase
MIDHFGAPWVATDAYRLRADARRFETWENNYAARLGLGVAVDYAQALGLEAIEARCRALAGLVRDGLRGIPGVTLHDLGPRPAAIVSFSVAGVEAEAIKAHCAAAGVNLSTSKPSSTLLDATARALPTVVRASPHYYNSEEEISRTLEVIRA